MRRVCLHVADSRGRCIMHLHPSGCAAATAQVPIGHAGRPWHRCMSPQCMLGACSSSQHASVLRMSDRECKCGFILLRHVCCSGTAEMGCEEVTRRQPSCRTLHSPGHAPALTRTPDRKRKRAVGRAARAHDGRAAQHERVLAERREGHRARVAPQQPLAQHLRAHRP